jgi:hypothetical protein
MTVTLNLSAELEKGLMDRARARGISLDQYVQEIITRDTATALESSLKPAAANLHDLLMNSPLRGAELDLQRERDYPRPVDIE